MRSPCSGRARFKSCPNHFDRCPDTVSLSVEDGGSVSFDGITNYTRGGSCGFQQEITRVQLTKINPEFGVDDDLLLSCDVAVVTCADRRVSLSRGNDPGYEFVFTLTGATVDDSGMYKVEVGVEHPRTGSSGSIIKMFHLNVSERT